MNIRGWRKGVFLAGCACLMAGSGGCRHGGETEGMPPAERPVLKAVEIATPITVDGKLSEDAWRTAPAYSLKPLQNAILPATEWEGGTIRLLRDRERLYVGIEFQDRDVQAHGDRDQQRHYLLGDLAEIFLKPENTSCYWEIYVTPRGHKTGYFFPSRAYCGLASVFDAPIIPGIEAAAVVDGSLNDYTDTDRGWSAELSIPLRSLKGLDGRPLTADTPWTILGCRYNYGVHLSTRPVLSSVPQLPKADFHMLERFGTLKTVSEQR